MHLLSQFLLAVPAVLAALFIGAMLGGFIAHIFHQPPSAFAVVGMAAVFGSAARVPIATLLMVTEMTGGYGLLVPAAFAVMLGFYLQNLLAVKLNVKYISLYEAQVKGKSDSPAHRMDMIKTAVAMLKERKNYDSKIMNDLDIGSLLELKIPFDVSESEALFLATLHPKSFCVGTVIKDKCLNPKDSQWEIVSIFRDEEMVYPHPDTVLEADDDLLILSDKEDIETIRKNLKSKKKKSN